MLCWGVWVLQVVLREGVSSEGSVGIAVVEWAFPGIAKRGTSLLLFMEFYLLMSYLVFSGPEKGLAS